MSESSSPVAKRRSSRPVLIAVVIVLGAVAFGLWSYAHSRVEREVRLGLGRFSKHARIDFDRVALGILPPRVRILDLELTPLDGEAAIHVQELVIREFDRENSPPHELDVTALGVRAPQELVEEVRPDDDEIAWSRLFTEAVGLEASLKYRFDPSERTLRVDRVSLSLPDRLRGEIGAELANLASLAPAVDGLDDLDALADVLLVSARLVVEDLGLIPTLLAHTALENGTSVEAVVEEWSRDVSVEAARVFADEGPQTVAEVEDFVRAPGELAFSVEPKVPFAFGRFMGSFLSDADIDLGPVRVDSSSGGSLTKRTAAALEALVPVRVAEARDQATAGNRLLAFELQERLEAAKLESTALDELIGSFRENLASSEDWTEWMPGADLPIATCSFGQAGTVVCGGNSTPLAGVTRLRISRPDPTGERRFVAEYGGTYDEFQNIYVHEPSQGLRRISASSKHGPSAGVLWSPDGAIGVLVNRTDGGIWYDFVDMGSLRTRRLEPSTILGHCRSVPRGDGIRGCDVDRALTQARQVSEVDEATVSWLDEGNRRSWAAHATVRFCNAGDHMCEMTGENGTEYPATLRFDLDSSRAELRTRGATPPKRPFETQAAKAIVAECDQRYVALNGTVAMDLDSVIVGGTTSCRTKGDARAVVDCMLELRGTTTDPYDGSRRAYVGGTDADQPEACQVQLIARPPNGVTFRQRVRPGAPMRTFSITID